MDSSTTDVPRRVPPRSRVVLDGNGLGLSGLVRLADAVADPVVAPTALDRVRRAHETADDLAAQGRRYGRGTGVGAPRSVSVGPSGAAGHTLRLLRSHAGGAGPLLPPRRARWAAWPTSSVPPSSRPPAAPPPSPRSSSPNPATVPRPRPAP
ncbi:aromatic amino acid lyase [Streptomyces sp. NPDC007901]|uniref:aromatic amino acid lyase n=1 Tax=Streptomyces sp. NPDC007901 TaxID=3364785 RepID=UPI0036DFC082